MFTLIIYIIALLITFIGLPIGIVMAVSSRVYNRRERDLRNEAEAHRKILESTYDRIWKEIKTRCGLSEEHRRSFNNVYPSLLDREMDDDTMLNWILDCNIDFDPEEYPIVMENIEDDRAKFVAHQRRMMNIIREHRELLQKRMARAVVKNQSAIRYTPVETGHDRWGKSL